MVKLTALNSVSSINHTPHDSTVHAHAECTSECHKLVGPPDSDYDYKIFRHGCAEDYPKSINHRASRVRIGDKGFSSHHICAFTWVIGTFMTDSHEYCGG